MKGKADRHGKLESKHQADQHVDEDVAEVVLAEPTIQDQTLDQVSEAKHEAHHYDFGHGDAKVYEHKDSELLLVLLSFSGEVECCLRIGQTL